MNKSFSNILLVVVIAAIVWGAFQWKTTVKTKTGDMKNAQMLDKGLSTPITTEVAVSYYPGAKGYFVRPAAEGNYPGVVMIHENRGLRPEIKETAEQLAREGYLVLAVDLYKGQVVETQEEARKISSSFEQKTGLENLRAAVTYLKSKGATKIGSIGWCFGGRQSIELAISGEKLDATVVYYGGNMATTVDKLKPIKWPVLGIFGGADQAIPQEMVDEFKVSLNTLGITNEVYVYPGVGHAFANPSGMNYAPEETKDAWAKTTVFLEKYLKN